jgi:hypothetical protein
MLGDIPTSYGPCSSCFNLYHHVRDCLEMRQFSNYYYEHMNTLFSRPGNDFYSDSYNPAWSQKSNFSWQAQTPDNYAPTLQERLQQAYHSSMINHTPLN